MQGLLLRSLFTECRDLLVCYIEDDGQIKKPNELVDIFNQFSPSFSVVLLENPMKLSSKSK